MFGKPDNIMGDQEVRFEVARGYDIELFKKPRTGMVVVAIVATVETFHRQRHQQLPVITFAAGKGGFVLVCTQFETDAALLKQPAAVFQQFREAAV